MAAGSNPARSIKPDPVRKRTLAAGGVMTSHVMMMPCIRSEEILNYSEDGLAQVVEEGRGKLR